MGVPQNFSDELSTPWAENRAAELLLNPMDRLYHRKT